MSPFSKENGVQGMNENVSLVELHFGQLGFNPNSRVRPLRLEKNSKLQTIVEHVLCTVKLLKIAAAIIFAEHFLSGD